MYRLSLIISEVYRQFLPLAEKGKICLNLNFSDTTQEVSDSDEIRQALERALDSAFERSDRGEISISVDRSAITITDQGTILSKAACALLSKGRVQVKSRVGFGTTVHIALGPVSTDVASPTTTLPSTAQSQLPKPIKKASPRQPKPTKSPSKAKAKPKRKVVHRISFS